MAKRASLAGNVAKPKDAKQAAKVAKAIAGQTTPAPSEDGPEYETVSYNLPLELIDLYRDLAAARHRVDQAERRAKRRANKAAAKRGEAIEAVPQARQSASAIVREAMLAYADNVRKELDEMG